jgi:hypothetical protein
MNGYGKLDLRIIGVFRNFGVRCLDVRCGSKLRASYQMKPCPLTSEATIDPYLVFGLARGRANGAVLANNHRTGASRQYRLPGFDDTCALGRADVDPGGQAEANSSDTYHQSDDHDLQVRRAIRAVNRMVH